MKGISVKFISVIANPLTIFSKTLESWQNSEYPDAYAAVAEKDTKEGAGHIRGFCCYCIFSNNKLISGVKNQMYERYW